MLKTSTSRAFIPAKTKEPSPELQEAAAAYFRFNQEAAAATKRATAERARLLGRMTEEGFARVNIDSVTADGSPLPLEATVGTIKRTVIDVAKFAAKVPQEVLVACAYVSKTAAEAQVGGAVIAACLVESESESNVSVKVRK